MGYSVFTEIYWNWKKRTWRKTTSDFHHNFRKCFLGIGKHRVIPSIYPLELRIFRVTPIGITLKSKSVPQVTSSCPLGITRCTFFALGNFELFHWNNSEVTNGAIFTSNYPEGNNSKLLMAKHWLQLIPVKKSKK